MHRSALVALALVAALGVGRAQSAPLAALAGVQPTLVASGIPSSGFFTGLASDRFGNIYVITKNGDPTGTFGIVHRITPTGTVIAGAGGGIFPDVGQVTRHPVDGFVYMIHDFGATSSLYCRINPTGGVTVIGIVPVQAKGMAIGDQGQVFFGGTGAAGPGIYMATPATISAPTLVHAGVGANRLLHLLPSGDLLVADGDSVHVITPGVPGSTMVDQATGPAGTTTVVRSLSANPFNFLGHTWLLGARTVLGSTGQGRLRTTGGTTITNESWFSFNQGIRMHAAGLQREAYYLSDDPGGANLYRIGEVPLSGNPGSLLINVSPANVITLDLSGPPGAPYLAGIALAVQPPGVLYLGSLGLVELDPTSALFTVTGDGVGAFGPANPFAVIPGGGVLSVSAPIPFVGFPVGLLGQVFIVDLNAPNGYFLISNVAPFTIL